MYGHSYLSGGFPSTECWQSISHLYSTVYSYIATCFPKHYNDSLVNLGYSHFCVPPTELMLLLQKLEARTIHLDLLHKCCTPVLRVSSRTFLSGNADNARVRLVYWFGISHVLYFTHLFYEERR